LARDRHAALNIFQFLESPYEAPLDAAPADTCQRSRYGAEGIQADRALREYYDERLGDFVDVGFRVCESARHNRELRRCLKRKEYQLLFIPYPQCGATFANMPIEEFAFRFGAPIALVGPERPDQIRLNPPAMLIVRSTAPFLGHCAPVQTPMAYQPLPVI
jgi:hypothetical protein